MNRHRSVSVAALGVALLTSGQESSVPAVPAQPAVLLLLADDLGCSDLGCYGSEIKTPVLDALAGGGVRFTRFYNSARCGPSRASLLTGLDRAVFAAMVDRMDQAIGRVVADRKENGQFDHTLILFPSDNGACWGWDPLGFDGPGSPKNILPTCADLKKLGQPGDSMSYASGWANAGNTPSRHSRHFSHEGGIRSPFIAHWPAGITARGELRMQSDHLIDVMPTLVELAGARYSAARPGAAIQPREGRSLRPAPTVGRPIARAVPLFSNTTVGAPCATGTGNSSLSGATPGNSPLSPPTRLRGETLRPPNPTASARCPPLGSHGRSARRSRLAAIRSNLSRPRKKTKPRTERAALP